MIYYFVRVAKRFVILLPGIVIAYLSVKDVFPYFDRRLPLAIAVLVTYILAAYVWIPALIRLFRIIYPPNHLPLYCVTPDGFASDPLNLGIFATRRQLITAMEAGGWHVADPHTPRYLIRQVLSIVFDWPYLSAPVSRLYLFGRRQDVAFEIQVPGALGRRHHVRFWATTYDQKQPLAFRTIHWHHRQSHVRGDNLLWVGAASLDIGLGFIRHNFQITHMIDPDTDQERDHVIASLRAKGLVQNVETIKLGKPYKLMNRVITGYLHADGRMAIVRLRQKPSARKSK